MIKFEQAFDKKIKEEELAKQKADSERIKRNREIQETNNTQIRQTEDSSNLLLNTIAIATILDSSSSYDSSSSCYDSSSSSDSGGSCGSGDF